MKFLLVAAFLIIFNVGSLFAYSAFPDSDFDFDAGTDLEESSLLESSKPHLSQPAILVSPPKMPAKTRSGGKQFNLGSTWETFEESKPVRILHKVRFVESKPQHFRPAFEEEEEEELPIKTRLVETFDDQFEPMEVVPTKVRIALQKPKHFGSSMLTEEFPIHTRIEEFEEPIQFKTRLVEQPIRPVAHNYGG